MLLLCFSYAFPMLLIDLCYASPMLPQLRGRALVRTAPFFSYQTKTVCAVCFFVRRQVASLFFVWCHTHTLPHIRAICRAVCCMVDADPPTRSSSSPAAPLPCRPPAVVRFGLDFFLIRSARKARCVRALGQLRTRRRRVPNFVIKSVLVAARPRVGCLRVAAWPCTCLHRAARERLRAGAVRQQVATRGVRRIPPQLSSPPQPCSGTAACVRESARRALTGASGKTGGVVAACRESGDCAPPANAHSGVERRATRRVGGRR